MALLNLTGSQKLWHFNIVVVLVLGVLFIAKTNPTSEVFTCNSDKMCTLERTYVLPPLNTKNSIRLYAGAYLEPIEKYHYSKHSSYYTYHLGLNNGLKKPQLLFKVRSGKQITVGRDEDYINEIFKDEISEFNNYKLSPYNSFVARSKANLEDFAFWLYLWVIIMTILMIWNIVDKNKGNA